MRSRRPPPRFPIKTHHARRPRTKGKVERTIRYLIDSFLTGYSHSDRSVQERASPPLAPSQRQPAHLDPLPRKVLTALSSIAPFAPGALLPHKAGFDSFVRYVGSRYSVPPDYVGQRVHISPRTRRTLIQTQDSIIAEHNPHAMSKACWVLS